MNHLKTLFFSFLFLSMSIVSVYGQSYNLLVGTYNGGADSEGIYVYEFDSKTGAVKPKSSVSGVANPSYLTINKSGDKVYSVSEAGKGKGMINAFNFDKSSGQLKLINSVTSGGDGPCYVEVDESGKFVFSGNYSGGTLAAIRVNDDGTLNPDVQSIQHEGSGVHKNQNKPHVHCVVLSPDNKHLLVADLGTNKVYSYGFDRNKETAPLSSNPSMVTAKPGAGPRHITFHPNGKLVYVVNELDGSVDVYDYKDGKLKAVQTITMLPEGFSGEFSGADIHCSPDGKFLYASNRDVVNEIVIYSIAKNGQLKFVGRQSTMGKAPRNFAIDPTGKFLLVANQNTNEIIVFSRDQKTGLLKDTGGRVAVGKPVCLKFVGM